MRGLLLLALFGLAYVYVGYPWLVRWLAKQRRRAVHKADHVARVTLLIAAHNEKTQIGRTLRNKLELDYPRGALEIVVISDGSTDGTDEIVEGFASRGVRLIRQEPRAGKTAALNLGAATASGSILAFADANSSWSPDALRHLVRNFADPEVGYVSGKMIYTDSEGTVVGDGCSAYMRYENRLRELETLVGSIVGVDGGIDAVRRSLYRPMRADQLPDFVLPLAVVESGHRVVYEPAAILKEPALARSRDEYRMRVRVALRALWALHDMRQLLNPLRHGLFAWQLWSHKVLRYAAIVLLAVALGANLALWGEGAFWSALLLIQLAGWLAAAIAWFVDRLGARTRWLWPPYYFALVNVAAGHALLKYLLRRKQVLWTPRKG